MSYINFVINEFANDLNITQTAMLQGSSIPSLGNGITAVYEVDTQVFRDTFQYHINSSDLNDNTIRYR